MPIGFFNIRTPQYFEFTQSDFTVDVPSNFNFDTLGTMCYRPTWPTNYDAPSVDSTNYYSYIPPVLTESVATIEQRRMFKASICIVPGNYTIDSLIKYINDAISRLLTINASRNFDGKARSASLSTLRVSDTGSFPIGFYGLRSVLLTHIYFPLNLVLNFLGLLLMLGNRQYLKAVIHVVS